MPRPHQPPDGGSAPHRRETVGHQVQHIYDKIGRSTRAGAALFAMENGLV
jgi:DNA-binding NarL/FixJ family response regulator